MEMALVCLSGIGNELGCVHAHPGITSQQVQLHARFGTVEIKNKLVLQPLEAEIYRHHIGVRLVLYSDV